MLHRVIIAITAACAALGAGCQIERFFPEDVGNGAGRLTVRNTVKLISLVTNDKNCGFASERVSQGYRQEGELGALGSITWEVVDCEMDFGDELKDISEDCIGEVTSVSGKVKISATKTVQGILTGNPASPVIPQSPDAVTIAYSADVVDYQIRLSTKKTGLTMQKGHIEQTASIHLAQAASSGVCSIPTADVTLNSIKVTDALYTLDDDGHIFDVEVPLLEEKAQLGVYNGFENFIEGTITVWDTPVTLEGTTLDPDYEPTQYREAFSCVEDIKVPVLYECVPLTDKLAEGAAKLTVNNVGNLVSVLVDDTSCGFASPAVASSAEVTGEVGKDGGEVVFRIDQPCALSFPVKTAIGRDCLGKTTYAEGTVRVTGTMRIRGRLSGDPLQPVIPTSRDPAEIAFNAQFESFKVSDDASDQALEIIEGGITGRMQPRMGLDTLTGACSIATPVVTFSDLSYTPSIAILHAQGNSLRLGLDASSLDAQSGKKDGVENMLQGSITVNGDTYSIPLDGNPALDPNYDAVRYAQSYMSCASNMIEPQSDEQCNFHSVIANGAARLIVQTVGTVASMVNNDDSCGFEDQLGVLIFPTEVVGDVGEMGSMTWDVEDCTVGSDQLAVLSNDCLGGSTFVQGSATVDATRMVEGERTTQFLVIDAIEPRDKESVVIWLNEVDLSEFVTYPLAQGQSTPIGKLTIHSGTLSATVEPATGQRADEPIQFDVPTPVAQISNIHLRNASATLEAQGKIFEIEIADTNLSATNGSLDGVTNQIAGQIIVDGDSVDVGGPLNPTFSQQSFDQSYACTENLLAPVR